MTIRLAVKSGYKNPDFDAVFEQIAELEKKCGGLELWHTLIDLGHDKIKRLAANVLRRFNEQGLSDGDLSHQVILEMTRYFRKRAEANSHQSPFGRHDSTLSLAPYLSRAIHRQLRRAIWRFQIKRQKEFARLQKKDTPSDGFENFDSIESQDVLDKVIEAVNELPEDCRIVIARYYLGGRDQTVRAIATAFGLGSSTVQDRLKKGLSMLQQRFGVDSE